MATADALEYSDVFALSKGSLYGGRLKLNKTGVVFKTTKTGKIDSLPLHDIESTEWLRVARGFGIKIIMKNGHIHRYDGFKELDYSKLKEFYKSNFDMELKETELSVKGWNWGAAKFKDSVMSFEVDNKPAFEIQLRDVSQATTGKNEVTIEFHRNEDAKVALMEMRFFVPSSQEENATDSVKLFHDQIMAKADIIQATGDAIVTFEEVACLTPRGRYSIRVYPTFLQLHGKTYDYKIPHQTVLRLFLLPHQDNRFMFFVVSMDPPLRQGQTRYPFLILQFERDEEMTCKLNLTEEEIETKYRNKLSLEMNGSVFEVVSRVLKEICEKKITVPGSFKSNSGTSAITCSYKASSGLLYPLERGFIFVHKPPVHTRFDEITSVNFARGSGTGRTFDFEIDLKNGTSVVFNNLAKDEYTPLFDFINTKKLRIKNKGLNSGVSNLDQMIDSDDDQHDAYLQKVKQEGREKDEDDEGSESSEDEDFNPANEKDEEFAEEYDSDIGYDSEDSDAESDAGSDGSEGTSTRKEEARKRKAEKKQKEVKPKKPKTESSGSSRKKGSKKDKNAPKRPQSAYMIFFNDSREQIKADNPGISFTDISKKGGEMWRELKDKSKWEELAADAKAKYEVQMKEYKEQLKESGADIESTTSSSNKSKKTKSKPKTIKDMMKNKTDKSRQSGGGDKYKSKEYIDSSDDSSSDDDKADKKKTDKKTEDSSSDEDKADKKAPETKAEDSSTDEDFEADKKSPEKEASDSGKSKSTRSSRAKGDVEELVALKEGSDVEEEDEAEFSGEQSGSDTDGDASD